MGDKRVINPKNIKAEDLAYWYFRLNGFLTIKNFVLHPDRGFNQRTEFDTLGVRFPYREELPTNPMDDDPIFTKIKDRPYIVISEATISTCKLNPTWGKLDNEIYPIVLKAIGFFQCDLVGEVAQQLYSDGVYEGKSCHVSLFCIGKEQDEELQKQYKKINQITWDHVLKFIHDRFTKFGDQKASHNQWDTEGQLLWDVFELHRRKQEEFIACIERILI